ncbi:cytochrome P450 4c3-like [Cylas formicarius]|uniref:cytochrome P450 4c3-like n=1 Tax=Cylas formicarius TaxID=197179 RepID=UPI00295883C3|nr:cytochrome P450 4c3-like [Cylas formicarius]
MLLLIIVAFFVILAISCASSVKEFVRCKRRRARMPCPRGYQPILGNLPTIIRLIPEELFRTLREWGLNYYPVYNTYALFYTATHICGPEETEALISTMKHNSKGTIYHFLDKWLGEGLLTSAGTKWQTRRKILTPAFHFKILQQFVSVFNRETHVLVKKLEAACDQPQLDITPYITNFTLETINETSMGVKLDVSTTEGKRYKNAIYGLGNLLNERVLKPWFYQDLTYFLSPSGRLSLKLTDIMHKFTDKVVRNREKNFEQFKIIDQHVDDSYSSRKKLAFLDILLNAKLQDGIIDDVGIRDEVNTFMFEGHDTTAVNLTFALMLIACHQNVQENIYQEIMQVLGNDPEKLPSYNDLQELQYMERCIKESLRLYPSVPLIVRKTEEDIETRVGIIPKGSEVFVHIYDLHRNPDVWPDPEKFDPDRFLLDNCKTRHPYAYIPFSAGPRNCVGQKFAVLEMKAALCGVLRKFKLEPVDTPETLVLYQDLVIRSRHGVKLKLALR